VHLAGQESQANEIPQRFIKGIMIGGVTPIITDSGFACLVHQWVRLLGASRRQRLAACAPPRDPRACVLGLRQ
jgi:hypothetical protein